MSGEGDETRDVLSTEKKERRKEIEVRMFPGLSPQISLLSTPTRQNELKPKRLNLQNTPPREDILPAKDGKNNFLDDTGFVWIPPVDNVIIKYDKEIPEAQEKMDKSAAEHEGVNMLYSPPRYEDKSVELCHKCHRSESTWCRKTQQKKLPK